MMKHSSSEALLSPIKPQPTSHYQSMPPLTTTSIIPNTASSNNNPSMNTNTNTNTNMNNPKPGVVGKVAGFLKRSNKEVVTDSNQ